MRCCECQQNCLGCLAFLASSPISRIVVLSLVITIGGPFHKVLGFEVFPCQVDLNFEQSTDLHVLKAQAQDLLNQYLTAVGPCKNLLMTCRVGRMCWLA